ncbi:hypothetical protein SNEBB_002271 [Seison nebaliae]|nr:hypothetical protein SNEBB_002271 [Seison nebaliae]
MFIIISLITAISLHMCGGDFIVNKPQTLPGSIFEDEGMSSVDNLNKRQILPDHHRYRRQMPPAPPTTTPTTTTTTANAPDLLKSSYFMVIGSNLFMGIMQYLFV